LQSSKRTTLYIIIPLTLSAFIHIWNPAGFPGIDQDEGHYMRRAMQLLEGLGPQESKANYFYPFDHPYFGQIFLGAILSLVNYPSSINPSVSPHSIEMLYLVPRVLMGILAVVDTFLVYKIADARYNRKVAFVSSTIFAVMPITWFLRRIFLDSIALPLILLSILFAIYSVKSEGRHNYNRANTSNKKIILILLSGIFLGLAIFTKMPVFTMIPLLAYILLKKSDTQISNSEGSNIKHKSSRLKLLAIWFVPVVLIPLIWPGYAISIGQGNGWLDGVIWQATRADRPFDFEMKTVFLRMDPVLMAIGVAGLAYAVIKRDYFILLWAFPYLLLIYFVNWVYFFHIIPIIAAFCISGAALIIEVFNRIQNKRLSKPLKFATISAIVIFGAVNSTLLISQNVNDSDFKLISFVTSYLPHRQNFINNSSDKVTLIGPNGAFILYWISSHVFNKNFDFKWYESRRDYVEPPITTEKFIMITDWDMRRDFTGNNTKDHIMYVSQLYNKSKLFGVFFNNTSIRELDKYPFTNILDEVSGDKISARGIQWNAAITVKGNYSPTNLGKNIDNK
jgi:4-amino-4-deoxy-L-arabinose transferase-like glycosyltransferase